MLYKGLVLEPARRARLTKLGWDDDLSVEAFDVSADPARDQVRIEVEACGVCYRDCVDRNGDFKFIQVPITPGHEAVGRVVAVGPDVTDWKIDDRIATMHRDYCGSCPACALGQPSMCMAAAAVPGLIIDGGYATHMVAPQRCFYRVPDDMPAAHAAVLHCTFGTAYRGLKRSGAVETDSHVLITGANGGVGTAAIQVATRLGARVTAVVRDEAHSETLSKLGASRVIVDAGDRFHKQIGGDWADVVVDCVGPPTFNASLRSLRPDGRLLVIGNVVMDKAQLNLGYVVTRGVRIIGSAGANRVDMQELLDLHHDTPVQVVIEAELDLAEADAAQRRVRAGGLRGRIVLL